LSRINSRPCERARRRRCAGVKRFAEPRRHPRHPGGPHQPPAHLSRRPQPPRAGNDTALFGSPSASGGRRRRGARVPRRQGRASGPATASACWTRRSTASWRTTRQAGTLDAAKFVPELVAALGGW